MTLSCNIRGLRALLSGSFFDPAVSCNLVSLWMQPVFEIIDPIIAREEFTSLAIIMSRRQPTLATLWLGAIILGIEKIILRPVRNGLFAVELYAAVWTGTCHSFINLRPHTSCVTGNKEINRPDESRLLYLQDLRAIRGLQFVHFVSGERLRVRLRVGGHLARILYGICMGTICHIPQP
jgi:hypothetical protein